MNRWSRDDMARLVAGDIPDGAYVNLGIGVPTRVANHLGADRDVLLHSENGVLGMGPAPAAGDEDPERCCQSNANRSPHDALRSLTVAA